MTYICNIRFRTKKAFREEVLTSPHTVFLLDPSITNPRSLRADEIKEGEIITVTSHPKRSWFAKITRRNGKLRVE